MGQLTTRTATVAIYDALVRMAQGLSRFDTRWWDGHGKTSGRWTAMPLRAMPVTRKCRPGGPWRPSWCRSWRSATIDYRAQLRTGPQFEPVVIPASPCRSS